MQALAGELGIDRRVVWTGEYRWDNDQASTFLRAADACVLPFDNGVMLNNSSFSSAAAHGLPIVTTKGPVLEFPFAHGENVFLCAPGSADALAGAMEKVIDDAPLQSRLSIGALQLTQKWVHMGGGHREHHLPFCLALFSFIVQTNRWRPWDWLNVS